MSAGLGKVNFFGEIEGESGIAGAVLGVEQRNGVAADGSGTESCAELGVDTGEGSLQLSDFNEVVSVDSHDV